VQSHVSATVHGRNIATVPPWRFS